MSMFRKDKKLVLNLRYMICLLIAMATIPSVFSQITAPTEIAGISAWWCADSVQQESGTPVSFWNNLVNTTESVSQPVADNSPTLVKDVSEVNNHAVLRFDGNDYLDGGDIMNVGSVGQTVFCVGLITKRNGSFYAKSLLGAAKNRHFLIYENVPEYFIQLGSTNYMPTGKACLNEYVLYAGRIDLGKQISFFQDASVNHMEIPSSTSVSSSYNFYIGTYNDKTGNAPYPAFNLNGDIAEMIFYNRPLSNIERQTVENYLRSKYFPGMEREQFSLGGDIEQEYSLKPVVLTVPDRDYFKTYTWSTGESTQAINVTKSGLYAVHVTDDWGYDYIDTVVVTMPTIRYIPDQTICDGSSVTWDCGLSGDYTYEWSSGETTQEITITKAGKYAVKVTDNQGYSIVSDTVEITVDDFSTRARLGADTTLCVGNRIGLVTRADEAVTYAWSTGEKTPTIVVENAGTYSLSATNELGCVATDEITVAVKGTAPVVSYVSQYQCEGDATELLSNSITTNNTAITKTQWIVEQDTLDGAVQTHTFSSYGSFPIQLLVTNEETCVQILRDTITIHPLPVAQFAPKISCQYTANEIASTSTIPTGSIASYEWTGLPRQCTDSVVWFGKDEVGTYPLSLKVVSDFGCTNTMQDNIEVVSSQKINFIHSRTCLNDTVMFFDVTEYVPYNPITDAFWTYDGTKYSYRTMIFQRLKDTLPHTVGLHVKTLNGCMNIAYDTVKAHDLPHPLVEERTYGCKGKEIAFVNKGYSYDAVTKRVWDIGGKTYEDEMPYVEFKESGEYAVSLEQTTEFGCQNSSQGVVVIEETPQVDFSYYPEYGAAPLEVEFTNLSDGATDYEWTFEQSVVVDDENPTYTFEDKTNSYAKLRASSEHGCSDSVIKMIPVQLSDMQLRVTDVDARINRGMIQYSIQILNTGNDVIPEMEIALSSSDFATMSETWYGALKPNDVLTYVFPAKTVAKNDELPEYVCATATISSSSQNTSYYSNQYCKDNTKDFTLYHLAPNPVEKTTTLLFSTSQAGTVTISCVDNTGKVRMVQELSNVPAGVHSLTLDCRDIPSGKYLLQIEQGKRKISTNFVKQ